MKILAPIMSVAIGGAIDPAVQETLKMKSATHKNTKL